MSWAAVVVLLAAGAGGCARPAPTQAEGLPRAQDELVQASAQALGGFAALAAGPPSAAVADAIVPACVPRSGPPYQIGAVGTFRGDPLTLVPGVAVDALTGTFCGRATVVPAPPERPRAKVCAELEAPGEGLAFDPVTTKLTLIPGVETVIGNVTISPDSFTALICDDDEPGPIVVNTTIQASAVPGLFGTSCLVGPIKAAVTGSITGSLKDFTATISSGSFPVDAVQPSPTCPSGLARNANDILGLPLQASVTGLTLRVRGALYLAPAQT